MYGKSSTSRSGKLTISKLKTSRFFLDLHTTDSACFTIRVRAITLSSSKVLALISLSSGGSTIIYTH